MVLRQVMCPKWVLGALALVLVSGCDEIGMLGAPTPPTPTLALYGGDAIAAVPQGYCIETKASRPRDGFAVIVACDTIAGENTRPSINGFVTVQVGAEDTAIVTEDPVALQAFLRSASGAQMLSVNGDASTVDVGTTGRKPDAVTVRFTDQAAPPVAGLQTTEWRGFFDVNGRLATVAVRGFAAQPLAAFEGQRLLEAVINAMQVINAPRETAAAG